MDLFGLRSLDLLSVIYHMLAHQNRYHSREGRREVRKALLADARTSVLRPVTWPSHTLASVHLNRPEEIYISTVHSLLVILTVVVKGAFIIRCIFY